MGTIPKSLHTNGNTGKERDDMEGGPKGEIPQKLRMK